MLYRLKNLELQTYNQDMLQSRTQVLPQNLFAIINRKTAHCLNWLYHTLCYDLMMQYRFVIHHRLSAKALPDLLDMAVCMAATWHVHKRRDND